MGETGQTTPLWTLDRGLWVVPYRAMATLFDSALFKRDIRSDLKERIAHAQKLRDHHAALVKEADAEINLLIRMLDAENARFLEAGNKREPVKAPEPTLPLRQFLLERLLERGSPMTKDELKELALAAGYLGDSEHPGRSIHITLVGLERKGYVDIDVSNVNLKGRGLKKESAG